MGCSRVVVGGRRQSEGRAKAERRQGGGEMALGRLKKMA